MIKVLYSLDIEEPATTEVDEANQGVDPTINDNRAFTDFLFTPDFTTNWHDQHPILQQIRGPFLFHSNTHSNLESCQKRSLSRSQRRKKLHITPSSQLIAPSSSDASNKGIKRASSTAPPSELPSKRLKTVNNV
ncbi:unnamed protein product [Orchesella dallaii]|uniref:Uncharacterized protein n=1 Tax=Orchesella dallaii TaxID=48710 RepID=A0ABP1QZP1_9HEXA